MRVAAGFSPRTYPVESFRRGATIEMGRAQAVFRRRSATRAHPTSPPWAEAHGYHQRVAPRPGNSGRRHGIKNLHSAWMLWFEEGRESKRCESVNLREGIHFFRRGATG